MKAEKVVQMKSKKPYRHTPTALCFEAEIKRIVGERGESTANVIARLSRFSGITERQIYNFRDGTTEITPEYIKIFCQQFGSLALGQAWFATFGIEQEDQEIFDLTRFASKSVRNVLEAGDRFLQAFDDGQIDGAELNDLALAAAKIQRDAVQMFEVANGAYQRRRAA